MNGKRIKLIGLVEDFERYPDNDMCINGDINEADGTWIGENQVMFKLDDNFKLDKELDKDKIGDIINKFVDLMTDKCREIKE